MAARTDCSPSQPSLLRDRTQAVVRVPRIKLFPALRVDVSSEVHGVVENATDDQYVVVSAADQEVPRATNRPTGGTCPALRQMPGEHPWPELGSRNTSDVVGSRCRVTDRRGDQSAVPPARLGAERLARPHEDRVDVISRGVSEAIPHDQVREALAAELVPSCPR